MKPPRNVHSHVVVSDTHCGCQPALCPPAVILDLGGAYHQSPLQRKLLAMLPDFWGDFVTTVTHGEPFSVVHNGADI